MNYIDERPFEQIVRERTLSTKYTSRIEELLEDILRDEENGFKLYKNTSKHTLYDNDLDTWKGQKKRLDEETKKEEDAFQKLCMKFQELGNAGPIDQTGDDEDEEEEVDELIYEKKDKPIQKHATTNVKKPQTQGKQAAALAKTLKTSMATSQQKLIDNQQKAEELDTKINYYTHYQHAAQGYIGAMRKLVLLYEKEKDKELLRKGLDFILDYTDMLMKRYVSTESCRGELDTLCESHYLPLYQENKSVRCMCYV